jgi:hypothetical protein
MNKVSPKIVCLSLTVASICISTPQSASAAGFFTDGSQLDITGSVVMPSIAPVTMNFLTYGNVAAPYDSYGNYFILGGTGNFNGLGSQSQPGQNTNYNIRSITQGQPNTSPFLRLGPVSTAFANSDGFGVRFVLDTPTFSTQSFQTVLGQLDVVILTGSGRWQVWDGANGVEVQGAAGLTSQRFERYGNNPVTYSATFTVVPEPSEVLGLLVVGASGALTLLRRRRLMSASK